MKKPPKELSRKIEELGDSLANLKTQYDHMIEVGRDEGFTEEKIRYVDINA